MVPAPDPSPTDRPGRVAGRVGSGRPGRVPEPRPSRPTRPTRPNPARSCFWLRSGSRPPPGRLLGRPGREGWFRNGSGNRPGGGATRPATRPGGGMVPGGSRGPTGRGGSPADPTGRVPPGWGGGPDLDRAGGAGGLPGRLVPRGLPGGPDPEVHLGDDRPGLGGRDAHRVAVPRVPRPAWPPSGTSTGVQVHDSRASWGPAGTAIGAWRGAPGALGELEQALKGLGGGGNPSQEPVGADIGTKDPIFPGPVWAAYRGPRGIRTAIEGGRGARTGRRTSSWRSSTTP